MLHRPLEIAGIFGTWLLRRPQPFSLQLWRPPYLEINLRWECAASFQIPLFAAESGNRIRTIPIASLRCGEPA